MRGGDIKRVIDQGLEKVSLTDADQRAILAVLRQDRRSHREFWRSRRFVLAAVCLLIALSAVAQALGVPVWNMFTKWSEEMLYVNIEYHNNDVRSLQARAFLPEEVEAWGKEVCDAILEVSGMSPALPKCRPGGYILKGVWPFSGDSMAAVSAAYIDAQERCMMLTVRINLVEEGNMEVAIYQDGEETREFEQDGVKYIVLSNGDMNVASWQDRMGSYMLSAEISQDEMEALLRTIDRTPQ